MPDIHSHTAIAIGASYAAGTLLGFEPNFLILAAVGSCLSIGREPIESASQNVIRKLGVAIYTISGSTLIGAGAATIISVQFPALQNAGFAMAGLIGFFGQPIIKSTTEIIANAWKLIFKRFGGGNE